MKELKVQSAELEFDLSLMAVAVLRHITDHTERYGSIWTVARAQGFESEKSLAH